MAGGLVHKWAWATTRICCAVVAALLSFGVRAAVPVEESVEDSSRPGESAEVRRPLGQQPGQQPGRRAQEVRSLDIPPTIEPTVNTDYGSTPAQERSPATSTEVDTGQLADLFYQMQVLQQELQDLRGQVEEQTFLVNRLQRDQKEQYLDLDRRLVALSENQPAPAPGPATATPATPALPTGALTERDAYAQAYEAMQSREFDASLAGFANLIETYPNGQFTPNAYYWIGELQLVAKSDAEQARQSFMQVVSLYPDHQKAPDAMFKLGVVYHSLDDTVRAKEYLTRVQEQHPGSSAAGLAAKYAEELK